MRPGYIPSEPIRTVVAEYVDGREMGARPGKGMGNGHVYSSVAAVAGEVGVSTRTLERFLTSEHYPEEMPFDLADDMLCKVDLVYLWQSDPVLMDIYQNCDLSSPPEPATLGLPPRSCDECGASYAPRAKNQRFCGGACREKNAKDREKSPDPKPRNCEDCGTAFTPTKNTTRYCSKRCGDRASKKRTNFNARRRARRQAERAARYAAR